MSAGNDICPEMYVNGTWVRPVLGKTLPVVNPTTSETIASVPCGSADDISLAVAAARSAYPQWSVTPARERAALLNQAADRLEEQADQLAEVITLELGMPRKLSRIIQLALPIASFRIAARVAERAEEHVTLDNSLVIREPVGVVAAITPWNYPLHQIAAKVAYAIGAGCTVVVKPSKLASMSGLGLARAMDAAGLPAGVFNMVTGIGNDIGEALVRHPDVDMVSFTGSTRAGSRVAHLAADDVKRVALELGGKSASVMLDDADPESAVKATVVDCMLNSGQTCSALTRLVMPRRLQRQVEELAAHAVGDYALGDPLDPGTRMGPVVSQDQRERIVGFIERALADGARLVAGGTDLPAGLERGAFVRPTVLSDVTPDMEIAQEEVFGPVLVLLAARNDDDAIDIANASAYGLSGAVWSADEGRALAAARRIRTGQVSINGGRFNPGAPFGGVKRSGYGREYGWIGMEEFLAVKSVQLPHDAASTPTDG